jgi:hypothetical protein
MGQRKPFTTRNVTSIPSPNSSHGWHQPPCAEHQSTRSERTIPRGLIVPFVASTIKIRVGEPTDVKLTEKLQNAEATNGIPNNPLLVSYLFSVITGRLTLTHYSPNLLDYSSLPLVLPRINTRLSLTDSISSR